MKRPLTILTVALLLSGTATCSKTPTGLEVLPETAATVQAAVDLLTTGKLRVPPVCGSPTIACPGGVADTSFYLTLTRDSLRIVVDTMPTVYGFVAQVEAVTTKPVPVTVSGINCTVGINTAASGKPTVGIAGRATFTSQTAGGPIDRLDVRLDSVTGLDAGDITLAGGTLCTIGSFGAVAHLVVVNTFQYPTPLHLCGAPGPVLFEPCPVAALAARRVALSNRRPAAARPGGRARI